MNLSWTGNGELLEWLSPGSLIIGRDDERGATNHKNQEFYVPRGIAVSQSVSLTSTPMKKRIVTPEASHWP